MPLEPLDEEQRENWRRILTAQLGMVPTDAYIDKYREAMEGLISRSLKDEKYKDEKQSDALAIAEYRPEPRKVPDKGPVQRTSKPRILVGRNPRFDDGRDKTKIPIWCWLCSICGTSVYDWTLKPSPGDAIRSAKAHRRLDHAGIRMPIISSESMCEI